MTIKLRALACVALALGPSAARVRSATATAARHHGCAMWSVQTPARSTQAEEEACMLAIANDDPLPAGWRRLDDFGSVEATIDDASELLGGAHRLDVTVRDDADDLELVRLYVSGELVASATRSSGVSVDEDASASATLSVVLESRDRDSWELRWRSSSGVEFSDSVERDGANAHETRGLAP